MSEQLDDGCHGDWSFTIVSVYIADYRRIFRSVAEPSDVRLLAWKSTIGHSGVIMNVALAPSDMLWYDVLTYI